MHLYVLFVVSSLPKIVPICLFLYLSYYVHVFGLLYYFQCHAHHKLWPYVSCLSGPVVFVLMLFQLPCVYLLALDRS